MVANKRVLVGLGVVALLAGGLLIGTQHASVATAGPRNPAPAPLLAAPAAAIALVFVSGAVVHPGLYQLSPDARIADALAAAGGVTALADPGKLPDLAARIHDGRQVNVPFAKSGYTVAKTAKLDVNTASPDELAAVPGMPTGLAAAIVAYRDTWGPFQSLSDLRGSLGLDAATLRGISASIRVVAG